MAYHVEFKTKEELEEKIKPDIERKIEYLEDDVEKLDRIKDGRLTEFEEDKLISKTLKLNRLKAINSEIDRVISAKEYKVIK